MKQRSPVDVQCEYMRCRDALRRARVALESTSEPECQHTSAAQEVAALTAQLKRLERERPRPTADGRAAIVNRTALTAPVRFFEHNRGWYDLSRLYVVVDKTRRDAKVPYVGYLVPPPRGIADGLFTAVCRVNVARPYPASVQVGPPLPARALSDPFLADLGQLELADPAEACVFALAHQMAHFLRLTHQLETQCPDDAADGFGVCWLCGFRVLRHHYEPSM